MAVEYTDEQEFKVSPKRLFKAMVIDSHHLLPKIIPHVFKRIDVVEGEGGTAGCIRILRFVDGAPFTHLKDTFEVIDTENLMVKVVILEGPMLGEKIESLHSNKWFLDSGDGGCILKWKTKLHLKPGHTNVSEEELKAIREQSVAFLKATDEYLLAHPEVCA
ncbi:major allergen Pru ar 1-like [Dorcoceras hygrometricum]|uniref:Major allergen Pru ar 1-like n=1 Tax=Dorcoceras hygrometricum TaxID=472368 RepID=A0A2Z7BHA9_9LAMI|nr:major allergen Pru ar 1-like [Dorcoceras hygrometricum]